MAGRPRRKSEFRVGVKDMSRLFPVVLALLAIISPHQAQGQETCNGSTLPSPCKRRLPLPQNAKTLPLTSRIAVFPQDASSLIPESTPTRHLKVHGTVRFTSGGVSPNTTIWVSPFLPPSRHSSEVKADSSGRFSIELNVATQSSGPRFLLLGAKHPEADQAWEVIDLMRGARELKVDLFLRRSAKNLDEPDLDEVREWLLGRLGSAGDCQAPNLAACEGYHSVLKEYLKTPGDSLPFLQKILPIAEESGPVEAQLLAGLMLMRAGAWMSAEKMLANPGRSEVLLVERSLLQGVLWNVLRKPEEGVPVLERMVRHSRKDALGELELGRARTLDEDWLNAQSVLDDALTHHAPRAQIYYLRIRTLLALGDTEEAYL
jgi:hypothetical protein